jgi:hypothetical protein
MADNVKITEPTTKMKELLRKSGSADIQKSLAAVGEMAVALETPLRKGIMSGDITGGIFQEVMLEPDAAPEFPLDFLAPGTEKDFVAYTIPNHGRIPERNIEGDYVMVPTYEIGNSIDWLLRYARSVRWDIVQRALQVLSDGFVKKINDDAWHTVISAAADRNIVVYDSDAAAGQFTKRLISIMKTVMRRNGGGNSTSINRGKLTDVYVSPEAIEDIRDWKVEQVDEVTRREIFLAGDDVMSRIFGVNLHDLDELGEGQEYQSFFTNELSGTMASGDLEAVVGLDLSKNDCFYMPVKQRVQVFPDDNMHRQRRAGFYGWAEHGFAALDNRRVILGSM